MEIHIDNRSGQELPLDKLKELAVFVLEQEEVPFNTELSISLVDLEEISHLNAQYRGKEGPTDILSFELDDPWDTQDLEEGVQLLLGDIVINPQEAQKHALLEEVSLEEELWVLVIHGILHLLGFDHIQQDEALIMEEREDRYFQQWEMRLGVW